jgi:alginate O-acetyltransferase complex protein AlgI
MYFNSEEFAIFFAVILALFWLVRKRRDAQNLILLVGSMFFYSRLHYSFPIYLAVLISISYLFGRMIQQQENERKRKFWLIGSLVVLSAGLIYTKYSGFILGSFHGLEQWQTSALGILVPVGISFYTFAVLGYVIDIYYESIEAEKNILTYATYISFFPQLLSGPIAAATTLLPQFSKPSKITIYSASEGIGEFVWGLFKKMVVADNLSMAVSFCFSSNNEDLNGSSLFLGAALFGITIYADFSGYSSMARGIAKLLGIDLIQNFNAPLFSTSVSEYWRRWHISLTNWLTAYIYNPIVFGLKHWRKWGVITGIFLTFLISGIWHGAGWQFIIFGVVNGLAIIYEILTRPIRQRIFAKMPLWLNNFISNIIVLLFMLFSWIFFRANSLSQAMDILSRICSRSLFTMPDSFFLQYLKWCAPLIIVEWIQRKGSYTLDLMQWMPTKVIKKDTYNAKKFKTIYISANIFLFILICFSIFVYCKKVDMAEYYYFKF